MSTLESVVRCDPDVLGGTPVFAGTRVPVKNLLDYLAGGDNLERFIDHFPSVTREQAVAALYSMNRCLGRWPTCSQATLFVRFLKWAGPAWATVRSYDKPPPNSTPSSPPIKTSNSSRTSRRFPSPLSFW